MILALSWLLHYYLSWREPCVKIYMLYIPKLISLFFTKLPQTWGHLQLISVPGICKFMLDVGNVEWTKANDMKM